jgi:hypothetical protein
MGGIYEEGMMTTYIEMGAHFVLAGADLGMLMAGATERAKFPRPQLAPERRLR